jgi:hypothetical protein
MEFQFEDRGAMTFQFLSGGDVFATVHALRVAADRWVDAADTMKEAGSPVETMATWYRSRPWQRAGSRIKSRRRQRQRVSSTRRAGPTTSAGRRPREHPHRLPR